MKVKITSFVTKNGDEIKTGKLNVFIGPNNVGKSQTLKDIHCYIDPNEKKSKPKLLSDIKYDAEILTIEDLKKYCSISPHDIDSNALVLSGISSNLQAPKPRIEVQRHSIESTIKDKNNPNSLLSSVGRFLIRYLGTEAKLEIIKNCESIDPDRGDVPVKLLHVLQLQTDNKLKKELKTALRNAFKVKVLFDARQCRNLYLRVVNYDDKVPSNSYELTSYMQNKEKLDDQGDGIKSFCSTILTLLTAKNRIILIDEPEVSLHPPQAKFLGKWIAENIDKIEAQIFISTHNVHFLSGLINNSSDVTICRLNRELNNTSYSVLSNDVVLKLSNDPLLSNQRVIEGLFHKGVIVCEGDSDRIFYQAYTNKHIPEFDDIFFTYSQNKQTIAKIISLFRQAGVKAVSIVDIDVINNSRNDDLLNLLGSQGIAKTDEIKHIIKEMNDFVNSKSDEQIKAELINGISNLLQEVSSLDLKGIRRKLSNLHSASSKWKEIKEKGLDVFPSNGCDLYLMPSSPHDIENFKHNYILVNKQLYYIQSDGNKEDVPITDFVAFSKQLAAINSGSDRLHLSCEQISELITSNGGHVPQNLKKKAEWLIKICSEVGIFIIPFGELEAWIHMNVKNKSKWVTEALKKINSGKRFSRLDEFLEDINSFFIASNNMWESTST